MAQLARTNSSGVLFHQIAYRARRDHIVRRVPARIVHAVEAHAFHAAAIMTRATADRVERRARHRKRETFAPGTRDVL